VIRQRVQVVVAHPDDETFGCGSLLLHAAATGAVTAVCCATRGEAGEIALGSGIDLPGLATTRERELHNAAALLGVHRVDLLEFVDSGMCGTAAPESLVGAPFEAVTEAVQRSIEAFAPDVLVTLDASDGHRDHARIRDAALAAARAADVPRVFLHCLPRSLMQCWVEHMLQLRPDIAHLDADVAALGTSDAEITTVIDSTKHLAVREKAIAAHASQTSPFEGLPADLRRAFLATDHLRRVVPPWTGGPPETALLPNHPIECHQRPAGNIERPNPLRPVVPRRGRAADGLRH
jgi:LmbE family N-acetylglucosaminyl deacetylase